MAERRSGVFHAPTGSERVLHARRGRLSRRPEPRVSTRPLGASVFYTLGGGIFPGARSSVFLRAHWERACFTRSEGASFQAPGAACFYAPTGSERVLRAPIERRFAEGGLPSPLHSPLGRRLKGAAPMGDKDVAPPGAAPMGDKDVAPPGAAPMGDKDVAPPGAAPMGDKDVAPPDAAPMGDGDVVVAPPHGRANTKSVEPARKSSVSGQSWGMRPATADPQPDGVAIY